MKPNIGQGDGGETFLFGGKRISKDDIQVQVCGEVDELNSYIGLVRSFNEYNELDSLLAKVQEDLFVLGSQLASGNEKSKLTVLTKDNVQFLEENIKIFENELPQLKRFILPAGATTATLLHVSRTICRRAERSIVALSKIKIVDKNLIPYINRLSDLLFILARWINKKEGKQEKEWVSR